MRFEFFLIVALTFCFTLIAHAFGASDVRSCNLPQDLELVIGRTYPGATVVTTSDLNDDDRKFFEADHHGACPGLIKIDFFGDGQPTLAIVLLIPGGTGKKEQTELIVAHRLRNGWNLMDLGGGDPKPVVPVVWSQPPGVYRDVYGVETIRATRPVIVFCRYEAWAILYAWNGKGISKIWISD